MSYNCNKKVGSHHNCSNVKVTVTDAYIRLKTIKTVPGQSEICHPHSHFSPASQPTPFQLAATVTVSLPHILQHLKIAQQENPILQHPMLSALRITIHPQPDPIIAPYQITSLAVIFSKFGIKI